MSRIGKQAVTIPEKTDVTVSDGVVSVKGPLGELTQDIHPLVDVAVSDGEVTVTPKNDTKLARSLWGTFSSIINNMVQGVNTPFRKKLVIEGVGYRGEMKGNQLVLTVGYSHPVELDVPEGLTVSVEKNEITIEGPDKEAVGEFAAVIRAKKKPEPYKGKGIRYEDEVVRRKQGKRAVT